MGRSATRDRGTRRTARDATRRIKKKPCLFCKDRVEWVDYKDIVVLRKFMSDRGKIRARRVSGCCTRHQREVAVAIKTARELALLPYAQRTVSERSRPSAGGRGRGEGGGEGGASERPPAGAGPTDRDDIDTDGAEELSEFAEAEEMVEPSGPGEEKAAAAALGQDASAGTGEV